LNILFYTISGNFRQHCRVDIANRRIVQNGSAFELSPEDFSCLDLNGNIVSGLAGTLDTVNRFDVRQQVMLNPIKISGLPRSIRYHWDAPFRRSVSLKLYK
jgi:hypothetical protein